MLLDELALDIIEGKIKEGDKVKIEVGTTEELTISVI
jgi:hypothetical protein